MSVWAFVRGQKVSFLHSGRKEGRTATILSGNYREKGKSQKERVVWG